MWWYYIIKINLVREMCRRKVIIYYVVSGSGQSGGGGAGGGGGGGDQRCGVAALLYCSTQACIRPRLLLSSRLVIWIQYPASPPPTAKLNIGWRTAGLRYFLIFLEKILWLKLPRLKMLICANKFPRHPGGVDWLSDEKWIVLALRINCSVKHRIANST